MNIKSLFEPTIFLLSLSLISPSVQAQQEKQDPAGSSDPADARKDEADATSPYRLVLGSFLFQPKLTVGYQYDSNIFAIRDNEADDTRLTISPDLSFSSNWEQHLVNLNVGGELGRYNQFTSEDYDDYWVNLDGRYDISEKMNIFGGVSHIGDHEERGTPSVVGTIPTTFTSNQAHLGIARRVGDFMYRLGGTFEQLDFDDSGPFNNDDRDRDVAGLGLRVNYLYAPNREFFIQAIRDIRDYKFDTDDSGFERDSDGHRLDFGFKRRFSNRLSMDGYLGRLYQEYEDTRFDQVDTLDFNAKLKYLSGPRSSVSIVLDRTLEETTLPDSSSYLNDSISLRTYRQLNSLDSIVSVFSASRADYQDVTLEEDIYSASFDWRHRLNPELYLSLSYSLTIDDSNQSVIVNNPANPQFNHDYVRQQVMLSLNTTLFDVEDPGFAKSASREAIKLAKNDWHGFYLGAQLGQTVSHARTFGIRGTSGNDYAEFGDEGTSTGLFLGYGRDINRWYLGVQAEADQNNQNLAHNKDKPISRTFNVEDKYSYALNLRGGYTLKSGPLIYGLLGRAKATFDTSFQINNEPANAVMQEYDVDGARYGIGTDIPLSDSLFLRMSYSYTNFDTYVVDAVTTAEEFNPSTNTFNLGLGWLFDGNGSFANVNSDIDKNGFYAGFQIGHGSLNSRATGVHNDSGSFPGTYNFNGDFGNNTGFSSGMFAGYGSLAERTYFGIEAELEGSSADWEHLRSPTGRDFGVEKKSAAGLGVRFGYQLNNGTLLYLSGSRMRARFVTHWEKGNNSTNYIERDDKVYGDRVGIGAEIPTSKSIFLRVNYSYTDYESYSFITSHGNTDDMTFDNSETLFRLGLGVQF